MISAVNLRDGAMGNKRKKLVTLATVKSLAQDMTALTGTIDSLSEMMKQAGIREVEFDGLITVNNAINQLNTSFLKLGYAVESQKKLR